MRKSLLLAGWRGIGAALAIGIMEVLAHAASEPIARVPFITSIVLVMALPDSEAARPRSVIGGHLVSSLAGLASQWLVGVGEIGSAVGVGLATFAMIAGRVVHPPAGIDGFVVPAFGLPAHWVLSPVLIGAVLLVGYAAVWRQGERWIFAQPPAAE